MPIGNLDASKTTEIAPPPMNTPDSRQDIRPLVLPSCKPDAQKCLDRIEAWFHQEIIDRVPVRFYHHNIEFETAQRLDTSRWATLEERWFDAEYQVDSFEASLEGRTFHGETFPVFWPNLGPNVYSAFYGGRLEFAEVTSWYEPVIDDLDDLSALGDDFRGNRYFRKLEELTRLALERCGGRYWVGYPDFHPSLDCVAAWRGATGLLEDMVCDPEKLDPINRLAIRDFHAIFDHFDAMIKAEGNPSITWMGIPSHPGKLHIPSCDLSSMISTAYFEEFSLPLMKRELEGMRHNICHVDGPGVARHLDVLLSLPEIHAIQWVQGMADDTPILQWIPLIQRVQAAGKSIIVDLQLGELDQFLSRVRPEGIFLCMDVPEGFEEPVLTKLATWK